MPHNGKAWEFLKSSEIGTIIIYIDNFITERKIYEETSFLQNLFLYTGSADPGYGTDFEYIFGSILPEFSSNAENSGQIIIRFLVLLLAIILTGIGAAMSLDMRLVPNPGDGIVQAIADIIHKNVGYTKNCFDLFNITITIVLGLSLRGQLIGVGIGTVLAVIGVGRIIALFNHLAQEKMERLSGIEY